MKNAKFWLIQIVMVAFVSLVFGSPIMAHDNGGKKWSKKWSKKSSDYKAFKAEKKDARFHKKMDRKYKKHANHKRSEKWKKRLDRRLAKHNAKYHASDPVVEPVVEVVGGEVCAAGFTGTYPDCVEEVVEEQKPPTCADMGLSGMFPNCS